MKLVEVMSELNNNLTQSYTRSDIQDTVLGDVYRGSIGLGKMDNSWLMMKILRTNFSDLLSALLTEDSHIYNCDSTYSFKLRKGILSPEDLRYRLLVSQPYMTLSKTDPILLKNKEVLEDIKSSCYSGDERRHGNVLLKFFPRVEAAMDKKNARKIIYINKYLTIKPYILYRTHNVNRNIPTPRIVIEDDYYFTVPLRTINVQYDQFAGFNIEDFKRDYGVSSPTTRDELGELAFWYFLEKKKLAFYLLSSRNNEIAIGYKKAFDLLCFKESEVSDIEAILLHVFKHLSMVVRDYLLNGYKLD